MVPEHGRPQMEELYLRPQMEELYLMKTFSLVALFSAPQRLNFNMSFGGGKHSPIPMGTSTHDEPCAFRTAYLEFVYASSPSQGRPSAISSCIYALNSNSDITTTRQPPWLYTDQESVYKTYFVLQCLVHTQPPLCHSLTDWYMWVQRMPLDRHAATLGL